MLLFSKKSELRAGFSKTFVVILSLVIMVMFLSSPVYAQEVPTCTMTIKSDVHTKSNPAYPGGVCGGKDYVWGYYIPHLDEFALRGFINYNISANPNGQTFELPMGDVATYANLIVYTIKVNPPKNEKPKEEKPAEQKPKEEKPAEQKPKENKTKNEAPKKQNKSNSTAKSNSTTTTKNKSTKSSSSARNTSSVQKVEQKAKSPAKVGSQANKVREENKNESISNKNHDTPLNNSHNKSISGNEEKSKDCHDKEIQKTDEIVSKNEEENKNLKSHIAKSDSEPLEKTEDTVSFFPIFFFIILVLAITGGLLYWWYYRKKLKEK